jgi:hypothetical protein
VPLTAGGFVYIVYRTLLGDAAVDILIHRSGRCGPRCGARAADPGGGFRGARSFFGEVCPLW